MPAPALAAAKQKKKKEGSHGEAARSLDEDEEATLDKALVLEEFLQVPGLEEAHDQQHHHLSVRDKRKHTQANEQTSTNIRVFAKTLRCLRFTKIMSGWKTFISVKPTNSPTQGQPQPKKKVGKNNDI